MTRLTSALDTDIIKLYLLLKLFPSPIRKAHLSDTFESMRNTERHQKNGFIVMLAGNSSCPPSSSESHLPNQSVTLTNIPHSHVSRDSLDCCSQNRNSRVLICSHCRQSKPVLSSSFSAERGQNLHKKRENFVVLF